MASNITIIRLEISETGKTTENAQSNRVPNSTSGVMGGFATSAIAGTGFNPSKFNIFKDYIFTSSTGSIVGEDFRVVKRPFSRPFDRTSKYKGSFRLARQQYRNAAGLRRSAFEEDRGWQSLDFYEAADALEASARENMKNFKRSLKKIRINTAIGLAAATSVYNMYSQNKSIGYNLSGATHAAQTQQRKQSIVNTGASIAGAAIINPWLAAGMIAHKAYQLAQTNRQELYQIRSSQIVSGILQERLVKDTIERRF